MKRAVLASVVIVALLAGCNGQSEREVQGYVEGDFVRVSLPDSGIVESVQVNRGDHVAKGTLLFTLDSAREKAALDKARSELDVAEAQLSNLQAAERNDEISALEAEIKQLKAELSYTSTSYRRKYGLSKNGAASLDEVERLRAEEQATKAKIIAAESRLRLGQQSVGRDGEIRAAQQMLKYRQAAVREAEANLALRQAMAPSDAVVSNIIYRPGETVTGGQAVLELLPPQNIKARFFLSPQQVGWVSSNPEILLQCVGCGDGITARVTYVAPDASYRPPILYSRNQSEKLVFLTEAAPQASVELLHPGQPLKVVFSK